MKKRKLGARGPELSVIGFGAWAIGGQWRWGWGATDEAEAVRAIQRALNLGVNWIDTAPVYGLGRSEEIVGKAIQGRRDEVIVATKCGLRWNEAGEIRHDISPSSIRAEVEDSLRRLRIDVIDLYQIHWPNPNQSEINAWAELLKLKKEGKVRRIGVSNFDVKLMRQCEKAGHVDSLQPPYNFFQREIETNILPYCREHGVGVVVYSPMYSGLLSGRFDRSRLAADDWRTGHPMFNEPKLSHNLQLVDSLRPIAEKYGQPVGGLAVAWTLRHAAVTSAIVGARSTRQVEENVKAADCTIDDQDVQEIEALLQQYNAH